MPVLDGTGTFAVDGAARTTGLMPPPRPPRVAFLDMAVPLVVNRVVFVIY